MSKKTKKSSKKLKSKEKKNTISIEDEYTGDISNFEEFASFYRKKVSLLSAEKKDRNGKSVKNIESEKVVLNYKNNEQLENFAGFYHNYRNICDCERKLSSCQYIKNNRYSDNTGKILSLNSFDHRKSKSVSNCVLSGLSNTQSDNNLIISHVDDRLYHEMYNTQAGSSFDDISQKSLNFNNKKIDPAKADPNTLKCYNEFKKYYEIVSGSDNNINKSSLEYLSELAYLDYYRNKINETHTKRDFCLGYKNCKYEKCWMEHCSNCSQCMPGNSLPAKCLDCSSCKDIRLAKLNEYLLPKSNKSEVNIKKVNQARYEKRKSSGN